LCSASTSGCAPGSSSGRGRTSAAELYLATTTPKPRYAKQHTPQSQDQSDHGLNGEDVRSDRSAGRRASRATAQSSQQHAASFVAAAAAAKAAGDSQQVAKLLGQAQAQERAHPTYYGSAWVALGRVMLTTSALGSCAH
jgi:hypothetical protein